MISLSRSLLALWLLSVVIPFAFSSKETSFIVYIQNQKDFKKLLRSKNNVLVHYASESTQRSTRDLLERVSVAVKGLGTLAWIDCKEQPKLCKKSSAFNLKHYRNGAFHMDYNRALKFESLVHFLKDPTGDIPWEEEPLAKDVLHLKQPSALNKLVKRDPQERILIMFYAPWCGFCKRLKPVYQKAASIVTKEVEGAIMAAMDVNKPQNAPIGQKYNISAFPTLLYFEGGEMRYSYPGENDAESYVKFLRDPSPEDTIIPQKNTPLGWKDEKDSRVVHLDADNFDSLVRSEKSFNIMFYAPWCGHCKNLKPKFTAAADRIHGEIDGKLGAVDCTSEEALCKRFEVRGYPTLKYFKNGEFAFDSGHVRDESSLVEFMRNPREAPPPERAWTEEDSEVHHLTSEDFKSFLKKKKHVLLMFYAPWCGHCKRTKPEFTLAAETFKDNPRVGFAAVDCTVHEAICRNQGVSSYPTLKYFSYYNKNDSPSDYKGGRSQKNFAQFILNKMSELESQRNEL